MIASAGGGTAEGRGAGGGRFRAAGLVAGPLLFAVVLVAPHGGLSHEASLLAAVFAWTVAWWVTEAVPVAVTALASSVLAIALGIAPAKTVLASYADPVIFLFIGSFMLARAMQGTGLDARFAFALLRHDWATRTPLRLLLTVGVVTCAISLWVSNTATTAVMLPIGVGLLRGLGPAGESTRSPFPTGLLLMLTWASSVAVGIPVGSPPNLIAIGMIRDLTGTRLTFFDWVAVAMPLTIAMLAFCWAILAWRYGRAGLGVTGVPEWVSAERAQLGPWTRAQVNVLAVFVLVAVLWMLPGAAAVVTSPDAPLPRFFEAHLPESAVALLGAVLLLALPTDLARGEFTLAWWDAARIDWGTILLFGGGLALGRLMFETGLAEGFGTALVGLSGASGVWALTAAAILAGLVLSEISSNTASASVVVPVMIAIARDLAVSPIPPALGAALGASFGFMLPISTPPNAIVYGSGLVPLKEMMRAGFFLDLGGAALIWLGLRILCPLLGLV